MTANSGAVNRSESVSRFDVGLRSHMLSVYNLMLLGMLISAGVAWATMGTSFGSYFYVLEAGKPVAFTGLGYVALFAPIGIILLGALGGRSPLISSIMYWSLTAINGISLSLVAMEYTTASIVSVFLVTAAAFAGLSLFGYTTRKSLSGMSTFLMMGLIGLLAAMIINMFIGSGVLSTIISMAAVIVFAGLTAYDTQKIKELYTPNANRSELRVMAVWGALSLYLDFLNLFLHLLSLMGNRK